MLAVDDTIQIPLRELKFTFVRSSGPGGQNVNKVNTKAQLRWNVTTTTALPEPVRARMLAKWRHRITVDGEIVLASQRFRDQGRNTADCLARLREMILAVAKPPVRRKKTTPTAGSKRRRRKEKESQSEKKNRRRPPLRDE